MGWSLCIILNCIETKYFSIQDFVSSYGLLKHLAAHATQRIAHIALQAGGKCC